MRDLIAAVTNLLNGVAEYWRTAAFDRQMDGYARGYEDGRADVENADVIFVQLNGPDEDEDDDDD